MVVNICVIGAGVVGLTSAVQIAETYKQDVKVTILADEITPNTTGNGSAGMFTTYFILGPGNDPKRVHRWGQIAFTEWHRLWKCGDANEAGISLVPVLTLSDKPAPTDIACRDIVFGWQLMDENELQQFRNDLNVNYTSGSRYVAFTCEVNHWMKYLMKRFQMAGGEIKQQHVQSFANISNEYDVIVNCTGLGARHLTDDPEILPVRGQTMRVGAPWQLHVFMDEIRCNQIAPNLDSVFLGGTWQYGDYNRNVDPIDTDHIRNGCTEMIKSIRNAQPMWQWAGLRPGRDSIRLEEEILERANVGKSCRLIHNYGHGGSGVTLSWGCAAEVVKMLESSVRNVKCKL